MANSKVRDVGKDIWEHAAYVRSDGAVSTQIMCNKNGGFSFGFNKTV